jgi:hypothetical protein
LKRLLVSVLLVGVFLLAGCAGETTKVINQTILSTQTVVSVSYITITQPITQTVTVTPAIPSPSYSITNNVSYIITQKTDSYWYFSWQITIKNLSYDENTIYVEINFLNNAGYTLEMTNEIVTLAQYEEKTIVGEEMVEADNAANIVSAISDITIY